MDKEITLPGNHLQKITVAYVFKRNSEKLPAWLFLNLRYLRENFYV